MTRGSDAYADTVSIVVERACEHHEAIDDGVDRQAANRLRHCRPQKEDAYDASQEHPGIRRR